MNTPQYIVLIDYADPRDRQGCADAPPEHLAFLTQQHHATISALESQGYKVVTVPYDKARYAAYLGNREDTTQLRSAWATVARHLADKGEESLVPHAVFGLAHHWDERFKEVQRYTERQAPTFYKDEDQIKFIHSFLDISKPDNFHM